MDVRQKVVNITASQWRKPVAVAAPSASLLTRTNAHAIPVSK